MNVRRKCRSIAAVSYEKRGDRGGDYVISQSFTAHHNVRVCRLRSRLIKNSTAYGFFS